MESAKSIQEDDKITQNGEDEQIRIKLQNNQRRMVSEALISKCSNIKQFIDDKREEQKNRTSEAVPDQDPDMIECLKWKNSSIDLSETLDAHQFDRCIKFIEYYEKSPFLEIPTPLPSNQLSDVIDDQFYIDFVGDDLQSIRQMLDIAMYIQYKPLTQLFAASIGSYLKGKSIEEIRELFDLVDDFTEEEKAQNQLEVDKIRSIPVVDED